jgi:hypothetical protein
MPISSTPERSLPQSPRSPLACTTPVPNALLDDVLPLLTGAEVKVLLVVLRQTAGWSVGGDWRRRKEQDWITQSQYKHRTGLASEAVSRSINNLVRRGLLEVRDGQGAPLDTPAARRACRGRLYYRACVPPTGASLGTGAYGRRAALPVRLPDSTTGAVCSANTVPPSGCSAIEVREPDTTKRERYKKEIRATLARIGRTGALPACAPRKRSQEQVRPAGQ